MVSDIAVDALLIEVAGGQRATLAGQRGPAWMGSTHVAACREVDLSRSFLRAFLDA